MSDMLVAQCPHCQTRFRLSQEHLQAAAGNVRCGACLKVFDASLQFKSPRGTETPAMPPAAPAPRPEQHPPGQGAVLIHDDLQLGDLDLEALGLDESILEEINPDARTAHPALEQPAIVTPGEEPPASDQADAAQQEEPFTLLDDAIENFPGDDFDGPMGLAEKDPPGQQISPLPPIDAPIVLSAREAELSDWTPSDEDIDRAFEFDTGPESAAAREQEVNLGKDPQSATGSGLEPDALDDMDLHDAFKAAASSRDLEPRPDPVQLARPTENSSQPRLFGQDISEPMRPLTATRDHGIFLRDQPARSTARHPDPPLTSTSHPASYMEPSDPADTRREPSFSEYLSLPDVVDEPLYLDVRPRARRPRRQWLWGLLCGMAVLALLGQALYYNFASLAHDARTRPIIEQVCLLAGCELPARVNIELIRSSNLTVRPHADFPNALAIDVILYNRADFAQPFPVLRMTFTDLTGRELSSRQFQPAEYVGGELAGSTLMPPQTPVHVGLSMLDPGPESASYTLDFLSP